MYNGGVDSHVIVALDTADLEQAKSLISRLSPHVFAFKIGHGLVLGHGLDVIRTLQDQGAQRIFLDMKFHDIPSAVALGVYEAARRGVWMMTMHASGGRAMMAAAVEAAADAQPEIPPILLGVTVLTSIDEIALSRQIGIERTLKDQVLHLSEQAIEAGLDGLVCSAHEVSDVRARVGPEPVLVTPGMKSPSGAATDQARVASPADAISNGANYVVIGRALTNAEDPQKALAALGL